MQHLNYCRQALARGRVSLPPELIDKADSPEIKVALNDMARTMITGVKFILPHGGRVLGDKDLKALNNIEELVLPFSRMALEFSYPPPAPSEDEDHFSKRIVVLHGREGWIDIGAVRYCEERYAWFAFPPISLPRREFLVRDSGKIRFAVSCYFEETIFLDYKEEVWSLYDLLNALACKNVHIEKSPAKATKQGKKVKAALPFDDYHYLTVDVPGRANSRINGLGGTHRAPREHLRRGHIRRLESGSIWVNACVVNAGIGSKVGKSYLVRRAQ